MSFSPKSLSRLSSNELRELQQQGLLPRSLNRRLFASGLAFGASLFLTPGLFAEELHKTPRMTEGPFYPDKLPLDTDNDLVIVNTSIDPSLGEITHLTGRILSSNGEPIRNAFVEIWQVDHHGAYLHSGSSNRERRDGNFQGYGRFLTDSKGNYYFRTIKPVPYPGRAPHIHFAVSRNGQRLLTTQMMTYGDPGNDADGVMKSLRDPRDREMVMGKYTPIESSKIGELAVTFDLVVGTTPSEGEDGKIRGGISKPETSPRGGRGNRPRS